MLYLISSNGETRPQSIATWRELKPAYPIRLESVKTKSTVTVIAFRNGKYQTSEGETLDAHAPVWRLVG